MVNNLPGLINIHTVRHLWHAGTGTDGPPEWDRLQLVKSELAKLGLANETEKIYNETSLRVDKIWE